MIANLTPEERQKNLQTAQEARKAKKEVWKANSHNLRQDFLDINHWKDLASKYKVRMPTSIEPTTTSRMRTYIKRCGLTVKQYQEISGDFPMDVFIKLNPDWPLYAFVGYVLEIRDELETMLDSDTHKAFSC